MKGCIVEFKKNQNRYEIIGSTSIKDLETRKWLPGVIYKEHSTFNSSDRTYKEVTKVKKVFTREESEFWRKFKLVDPEKPKAVIYYGMSGAFKGTTIDSIKLLNPDIDVLKTSLKYWKSIENILGDQVVPSSLNYANLYLNKLKDCAENKKSVLIERGVTDMIFFHRLARQSVTEETIQELLEEEKKLLEEFDVTRILLVQKDKDIIEKYALSDITRVGLTKNNKPWYSDLDSYLEAQDKYVNFTKETNIISETIEITNASDYLESIGTRLIE